MAKGMSFKYLENKKDASKYKKSIARQVAADDKKFGKGHKPSKKKSETKSLKSHERKKEKIRKSFEGH
jgi:hypothetical protein